MALPPMVLIFPCLRRLCRRSLGLFLAIVISISSVWAQPAAASPPQKVAREIFHTAFERRYTWDSQFPGYSADVSLRHHKTLYRGIVRVNPDLSVAVLNLQDDAVRQLVKEQLQMVTTHHRPISFETLHGQHTFEAVNPVNANLGTLEIREVGDSLDSSYKVRDQKITQVNRLLGSVAVTMNALGFFTPPEGYLVAHYQSIFRDPQTGAELQKDDVRDIYDKVGKYYLLTRRYIRHSDASNPAPSLADDTLMSFDAIQLLRPQA